MLLSATFRRTLESGLVLVLAAASCAFAGPPGGAPRRGFGQRPMGNHERPRTNQEHLEQWMNRHGNLSPQQQQHALENEPGFRQLPPQTQQHLLNRLNQLNEMSPEQRRRFLESTEDMERLTPPQRQQVRGAMQQLRMLPEDRRRLVARTFRDLRGMPPAERESVLHSEQFQGQFSAQERGTLSDLLAVEPYLPVPPRPNGAMQPPR